MKPERMQFNGGELSPWLAGRTDIAGYDKTARLCRNFIPLAEGSLKRRGGTHFVTQTPLLRERLFTVKPQPAYAEVYLNRHKTNTLAVADGDTVSVEIKAKGFITFAEKIIVHKENATFEPTLTALSPTVTITLKPTPEWAEVKINGVSCQKTIAPINEKLTYLLNYRYQNMIFYPLYGTVIADKDKVVPLVMDEINEIYGEIGDLGEVTEFRGATYVTDGTTLYTCLYLKFTKGAVPVLFTDDAPETLEHLHTIDGDFETADSVLFTDGKAVPVDVSQTEDLMIWKNADGVTVQLWDKKEQLTHRFKDTVFDERYTAVVAHGACYVYRNYQLIRIWKGERI